MFLIGSTYFFKDIEGFKSKDKDYLDIVEKGIGFEYMRQITTSGMCKFTMVRKPKRQLIEYALTKSPAMGLGKFLIPEVCKDIEFTINDLEKLRPLRDKLDKDHQYEAIIYNAYIENDDFILTDEQLQAAYESYKAARAETESKDGKAGNRERH